MSSTTDTSGIAKYIFEYKKSTVSTWTTALEQTTRPSEYKFTGLEVNTSYNFRIRTIDNAGNTGTGTAISQTTEGANDPMNPNIDTTYGGLTVAYSPKSGQTYTVSKTYSGYSTDQNWSSSDYSGEWSVWGTDDENIYIISSSVTGKSLALNYISGYNNGVTLLDTICDTVYTDKTTYPGSAGQNLKLEQVLAVKATSFNNSYESYYGKAPYSYNFKYPYIWNAYEKSQHNSIDNRSKAYALTTNTTVTEQSCNPYYTLWYSGSSNALASWVNSNYYSMVIPSREDVNYWLSSRYTYPGSGSVFDFGLECIGYYSIDRKELYGSMNGKTQSGVAVRSNPPYRILPYINVSPRHVDHPSENSKKIKQTPFKIKLEGRFLYIVSTNKNLINLAKPIAIV